MGWGVGRRQKGGDRRRELEQGSGEWLWLDRGDTQVGIKNHKTAWM